MYDMIHSSDPHVHSINIQRCLEALCTHLQIDICMVDCPRFQALAETTKEVLKGLHQAYCDYNKGCERAWGGGGASK